MMREQDKLKRDSNAARAYPHVPTSAALGRMVAEVRDDRISLAWLIAHLHKRSFGLLMFVIALIGLMPGIATLAGLLLIFPAIEMIMGRERPTLPGFLARRSFSTRHFVRLTARLIPWLQRLETLIRPRWQTPFEATKRIVGLLVLALSITIMWPFPLSYIAPTLVIMMISIAYLEEDGLLLCISLFAALLSFAFTAATVWATLAAAHPIEHLWTKLTALIAAAW
jgi:hypothetical protein